MRLDSLAEGTVVLCVTERANYWFVMKRDLAAMVWRQGGKSGQAILLGPRRLDDRITIGETFTMYDGNGDPVVQIIPTEERIENSIPR